MGNLRTVLSVAASRRWFVHQIDVYNVFLQGNLHNEIYMEFPQGFKRQRESKQVCRLLKSLYSLKKAPRQ